MATKAPNRQKPYQCHSQVPSGPSYEYFNFVKYTLTRHCYSACVRACVVHFIMPTQEVRSANHRHRGLLLAYESAASRPVWTSGSRIHPRESALTWLGAAMSLGGFW